MKKFDKIIFIIVYGIFLFVALSIVYGSLEFEKKIGFSSYSISIGDGGMFILILLFFMLMGWIARGEYEKIFKSDKDNV
jgi:hypothetical protein